MSTSPEISDFWLANESFALVNVTETLAFRLADKTAGLVNACGVCAPCVLRWDKKARQGNRKLLPQEAARRVGRGSSPEHEVRAFVRSPEKVEQVHLDNSHLSVIQGDVLDTEAVERAVQGADAVLSALGSAEGSPDDVAFRGGENILAAMQVHDVPRLVILGGRVLSHPTDLFSVSGRVLSSAAELVAGDLIDSGERFMRTLIESDLEWVMIRPSFLRRGPRTRDYRTEYLRLSALSNVSRANVAAFMVRAAETDRWVGEAPMIAN